MATVMRLDKQLVSTGYTVTVLHRVYIDEDLTVRECRLQAGDLIRKHRADVLAQVTFQTSIFYDVMVWSHGYIRVEHYHNETVAETKRGYEDELEKDVDRVKELGNKIRENGSCQEEGKLRRVELATKELESLFREDRELIQAWRSDFVERVKARNLSREGAKGKSAEDVTTEDKVTPKADAPTVAVSEVTARADRMATVLLDGMEGVPPDKFYIPGSGTVEAILNDGAVLDVVIDNDSEAVIIDEDLAEQVGMGLDRSYLLEIETVDGRKQQITWVCYKAAIEIQGVRVTMPVFAVKNCNSDLLLGRTWLSHVHAMMIERSDESQTLSIKKLDETRVMIETVEPRDPRNRAALAVGEGPSDRIKSLPISGLAVRFPKKKYEPLFSEEEGRIVEVKDLGSRLIVDGNLYSKEADEESGGVVSVSF
ncbi:hypothetical protein CBR_g847 [Chara braunii]|uniref:Uncharacterized protein n=1 Tax=Chara braunii TaxID=69332 RepID=A0A388KCF3_CHABU|nr:hypothetical protein CBR_g847 [Chara braunii]|eukprot:GBG67719.1 hypothetical protein CBR_g847 [Chara braunii]